MFRFPAAAIPAPGGCAHEALPLCAFPSLRPLHRCSPLCRAIIVAVGVSCARGGGNTLLHRVEYLDGGEQETVDLSKEQHEWEDGRN